MECCEHVSAMPARRRRTPAILIAGALLVPILMIGSPRVGLAQATSQTQVSPETAIAQMEEMLATLQTMLDQLQQGSTPAVAVTPVPAPMDMNAMMAEMQVLNAELAPLMARMQTAVQGGASAEEIAAIRAEVDAVKARMDALMAQMVAARDTAAQPAPAVAATPAPMAGMAGMGGTTPSATTELEKVQQMLDQIQSMLDQMQAQSAPAATDPAMAGMAGAAMPSTSQAGSMPMMDDMGMPMDMDMPMGGAMATPNSTMGSTSAMPMGDMDMMAMMDDMMDMMDMMDSMMAMMDGMDMPMGGSGGGMAMPMPGATPDPAMGGSMPMMDDM